jgi:Tfp pilus assembly protein PilF
MMHRWIACLLVTALVAAWSASASAQNVPEEARRHMARGIAAVEMAKSAGDYVLAALEFEKAAKLAPDWPLVYYNLGSVQSKMGDPASAIKSYQRYLGLAPRSPDAEKVRQEIYKLEYMHDRQKLAATLSGAWKASNGQTFKLLLDGPRLQLKRDEQQGDDVVTIKSMGTHTGAMTDAPPLVFLGTLIEGKITGLYMQAAGKSSGHCDLPERKGTFEGTVDSAAGQMRIVYNRVTLEYEMEFKSILSDELICWQTARKETPGYVLELKRIP